MKKSLSVTGFYTSLQGLKFYLLAGGLVFLFLNSSAQEKEFSKAEDSLKKYIHLVHFGKTDNEKYANNELFSRCLEKTMQDERSFTYPFDSLLDVTRLEPDDKSFRMINWSLPLEDGTFEYFGFIQLKVAGNKGYRVYELSDKSAEIESPATTVLPPDRWFGALYYMVIENKYKDKKYYTLLGWDGNNLISRKKLIDVLSFRSNGQPQFGAAIFKKYNDKEKPVRIIFEYSARASMSLRFEKQYLHIIKQSKDRKTSSQKTKLEPMIVFDNLVPLDARLNASSTDLAGQYQFYVPETNILNGFILKDGRWYFTKDIDARNPRKTPVKKSDLPKPSDYPDL